jgi:hypothetical protein
MLSSSTARSRRTGSAAVSGRRPRSSAQSQRNAGSVYTLLLPPPHHLCTLLPTAALTLQEENPDFPLLVCPLRNKRVDPRYLHGTVRPKVVGGRADATPALMGGVGRRRGVSDDDHDGGAGGAAAAAAAAAAPGGSGSRAVVGRGGRTSRASRRGGGRQKARGGWRGRGRSRVWVPGSQWADSSLDTERGSPLAAGGAEPDAEGQQPAADASAKHQVHNPSSSASRGRSRSRGRGRSRSRGRGTRGRVQYRYPTTGRCVR